ncbi:MAG: class I SAM-dependent methyltransferase [Acidimicrobiales bacterium]
MSIALRPRHSRDEQALRVVDALHGWFAGRGFDIPIRRWDGGELGPADARWRLILEHPWSLRSLLLPPTDLNAGEAYIYGEADVAGSMVAALRTIAKLRAVPLAVGDRLRLARQLRRLPPPPSRESPGGGARFGGRLHSRERDAQAVRFHYDVGNDFYRLFLDRRLVYSCAYFDEADREAPLQDEQLDRAQRRKLDLICRKLHLQPGETFLDIGCGWGSLVLHAAQEYGVRALGVTLSEQQAALAKERIAAAGLEDRVEVRVADYRDVDRRFDAVASVGMFEHVGAAQLGSYFERVFELTAQEGRFLNHGITTGGRGTVRDFGRRNNTFVGRYVFPDGALLPARETVRLMEETGFELVDVEQLRPHYARTLSHWVDRLERHADEARRVVGDATYRVWRAYMAGSVIGFETNDLGVVQVLGGKGWNPPWGRAHQRPTA